MHLVLAALVSLVIASAMGPASAQKGDAPSSARLALIIGNANYQDAEAPLKEPVNDARALAQELRAAGFDVDLGENLSRDAMRRALDRLYEKIKPGAAAFVFFSGYGIQSNRQNYMIPVDAHIWTEAEVRRDGVSLDTVLSEISSRGAGTGVAVLDASRRNPFERHYRLTPAGLASSNAPRGMILMYSTAPGSLTDDAARGAFVSELIKHIHTPDLTLEEAFNRTGVAVSRASQGEQVPWFSSSLSDDFSLATKSARAAENAPDGRKPSLSVSPEPKAAPKVAAVDPPKPATQPSTNTVADAGKPSPPDPKVNPADSQKVAAAPPAAAKPADVTKTPAAADPKPASKATNASDAGKPNSASGGVMARLDAAKSPPPADRPSAINPADDAAIKSLSAKLDQDSNDATAFYKRGQLYAKNSDFTRAAADFDAAIRLNPKDPEAFNNRCWARAMLTDLQMALQDCNEALRLRPTFAEALDSRGFVNLKLSLINSAIADYDAALRLKPNLPSSLYGRGIGKLRIGKAAEGNADIAAAKALDASIADEFAGYGIR